MPVPAPHAPRRAADVARYRIRVVRRIGSAGLVAGVLRARATVHVSPAGAHL